MTSTDQAMALAAHAIDAHTEAGQLYAELAGQEMELEADRASQKQDAIARIMQGENLLNGRAHSASSAEAVVETDHAYRAYLRRQSETVAAKNQAYTMAVSSRLRAELAIAILRHAPADVV